VDVGDNGAHDVDHAVQLGEAHFVAPIQHIDVVRDAVAPLLLLLPAASAIGRSTCPRHGEVRGGRSVMAGRYMRPASLKMFRLRWSSLCGRLICAICRRRTLRVASFRGHLTL
jgi:hypothetical protein